MSYARMNHAEWIEGHIRAEAGRRAARAAKGGKPRRGERPLPTLPLSDFQARVVDILGITGGGIYNAPLSYNNIEWQYGHTGVSATWRSDLATYDRGDLTMLVLLCHAARIRLEIAPAGPHRLRLSFWQRKAAGQLHERHPNITEAVAFFQAYVPGDHRVIFADDKPADAAVETRAPGL